MFRVRVLHPSFFGFRQSYGLVKFAKRTVLHLGLYPKSLDVEWLTLNTNSNTLNINQAWNLRKHSYSEIVLHNFKSGFLF